ncbi:MAG: ornithine cyclodeaminase family protein [Saprospiraceae bacterium]|nr:ornithine cyclodeaminase family protein [Saprospiraceae bacterium]MCB9322234.1 ornithine cyclodeaminase family protein [Lewinellaceae bacterium]
MQDFAFIDSTFIENHSSFPELVEILRTAFAEHKMIVPMRHHHDFPNPGHSKDSTMLLMPAWEPEKNAGVKIVAISPDNRDKNLPTIQGTYLYFDAPSGSLLAILEAKTLTNKRTAAASALAADFLSRKNASTLLMIGTGSLAPDLVRAHCSTRPIRQIWIYGRNHQKAKAISERLKQEGFNIQAIDSLDHYVPKADIISCATLSETPLFPGKLLQPGQHLDLVGSYKPNMREADDETITRSDIFLDNYSGGLKETGDIVIPIQKGIMSSEDIKADLFELSAGIKPGRQHDDQITLFKSVGHALEDLAAATYYYEKFKKQAK